MLISVQQPSSLVNAFFVKGYSQQMQSMRTAVKNAETKRGL